jgi:hypothetical protein
MASSGVSLSNYLRLVRDNRNFRRLWIAQIVISPRMVAIGTGVAMFLPAAMWALALRLWKPDSTEVGASST